MIKIIDGNLLEADVNFIIHSCNCQGIMGGGIARQIAQKWPRVAKVDRDDDRTPEQKLGKYTECDVLRDGKFITVINLYGQLNISTSKRMTNYNALANGLERIKNDFTLKGQKIGFPYLIGCGLGGGNWTIVSTIIDEYMKDYDYAFYRYTP